MRKILISFTVFLITFGTYFLLNKQKASISELRENHEQFIKNHPFSKTLLLTKEQRKAEGLPPNKYFEQKYLLEMNPKTGKTESEKLFALQDKLRNEPTLKTTPGQDASNMWTERGPNNVPGRTRAILFDPNDPTHKRVFAGGVSGGLWKTEDIETYSELWEQIDIPENLAISSITYDVNNPQNMFIGTGESYISGTVNGNGIWRSTDGGTTWEHIMGGSTGTTFFNGDATLTVNTGSVSGEYPALRPVFGPQTEAGLTADMVLVDDGSTNPTFGCQNPTNDVSGKIAVIERGACAFVEKVLNAQEEGAIGVVIVNSFAGVPIVMGGSDSSISIPSLMISHDDGISLMTAMENETLNVTLAFDIDNDPSGILIPGTFHINDIRTRDNEGTTEIYTSVTDNSYAIGGGGIFGSHAFGLYKSVDNGDTWTKLSLPPNENNNPYMPNDIEIGSDGKIWITTSKSESYDDGGGAILSSSDGTNFVLEYTIPGDADRTEIGISTTNPDKMYIVAEHATSNVIIYKTTDGFTNTTSLSLPVDAGGSVPANDFTRGQSYYDLMIAVDPNNDEILYVGGIDSFRSTDGGTSWSQMSKWTNGWGQPSFLPLVHADQHELIFHPTDSDKGLMATDGGVFYATSFADAPSNNTAISATALAYNTTQFYKAGIGQDQTNDLFIAGAQDNGTFFKSNADDGINSFSEIQGGDGMLCFVDKDGDYMIGSNPNNNFYRFSITGSLQAALISENNGSFVDVAELDDNLDILYTNATNNDDARIARLKNITGTVNKTYLLDDTFLGSPSAMKVSPYTTNSSTLFVGTVRGNVFRVDNADTSAQWTTITGSGFYGSVSSINFGENEDEIMVTYHNYGVVSIWFTDDGGTTWQNKEGDFPDIPVKDILMNPSLSNEVIVATDLGVWMTDNFDAVSPNWVQSQNGMKDVLVTSFDLRTSDNTVLASTYGRGLFTGQFLPLPVASIVENELSSSLSVYPTVSNGNIHIRSSKAFKGTKISILNLQGKQVYSTSLDLSQTENQISVSLQSGIYFIKFSNMGLKANEKIIIK